MKHLSRIAPIALALALSGCAGMSPMGANEWTTLFDGKGIDGFDRVGDANWRVADGLAMADKGNGFLLTRQEYGDFQIRVEFWAESDTNSGIFLRCSNRAKINATECYEVNIWDTRPAQEYATGGIVDVAKVSPVPKAGGRWNTYLITAKGDHLVVELNGQKTAEAHDAKHARGPIGLQRAPGNGKEAPTAIKFRKVEIRPL
jgi:hypothetical protein